MKAFPRPFSVDDLDPDVSYPAHTGMDLRDYFAAKAMLGLASSPRVPFGTENISVITTEHIAELAYKMADAMMEARDAK